MEVCIDVKWGLPHLLSNALIQGQYHESTRDYSALFTLPLCIKLTQQLHQHSHTKESGLDGTYSLYDTQKLRKWTGIWLPHIWKTERLAPVEMDPPLMISVMLPVLNMIKVHKAAQCNGGNDRRSRTPVLRHMGSHIAQTVHSALWNKYKIEVPVTHIHKQSQSQSQSQSQFDKMNHNFSHNPRNSILMIRISFHIYIHKHHII